MQYSQNYNQEVTKIKFEKEVTPSLVIIKEYHYPGHFFDGWEFYNVEIFTKKEYVAKELKPLIQFYTDGIKKRNDLIRHERDFPTTQSYNTILWLESSIESSQKKIEEIKKEIKYLAFVGSNHENSFEALIPKAKLVPITNYVSFSTQNGNTACCLWHDEKTASMKYYPDRNKTYCFGCNKSSDVIDVVMKLHGLSFKDAVILLTR